MPSRKAVLALTSLFLACAAPDRPDASPPASDPQPLEVEVYTSADPLGAVNSTIVLGQREALVIDAQYTRTGATEVADRIEASGRTLSTIFITHAHPDHYFGATVLTERFPEAKVVAVPSVVEGMRASAAAKAAAQRDMLGPEFPGDPVIPEPLAGDTLTLEGQSLRLLVDLQGDTHPVTGVVLPDGKTAVLSDVLFSDVHVWTADSTHASREAWSAQLDTLAELDGVERFIPGHQTPDAAQSHAALDYTRAYLDAFDQVAESADASDAIIETMTRTYPDAGGVMFLQIGAKVATGELQWQ